MSKTEHYGDYKWIKVKRYQDDPSLSWEERYRRLEQHHAKETTFLIEEIRRLAAEYEHLLQDPRPDAGSEKGLVPPG